MLTRKHNMTILATVFTLALFVLGMGAQQAAAVVSNWTGIGDGSTWTLATNWDNGAPSPDIAGGDTYNVGPGFSPTLAAGQVNMGLAGAGTATLNINNTIGTLALSGLFGAGPADAQITQTSGTFNVGSANGMGWGFTPAGHTSTYNMNGGALSNVGFLYLGRDVGATANFIQTSGAATWGNGSGNDYFNVASSFVADASTALYEISGGSMTINTGDGDIRIGSGWGAVFDGGAGTFKTVGSVAGGGPSAITWNGNANVDGQGVAKGELAFTMDASGVTPIALNGALDLTNSPDLLLDFTSLVGTVGDIVLVNNDLADAISGTFASAPEGTLYHGGLYQLSYLGLDGLGNDLVLLEQAAAVPEPSTFALAALGLLALGFVGWRPRRTRG